MGHRAPWRHCERRNLALATREALQHRALRAVAARGALAFHTARWLPRTREGIVVNIRLVSLLTLLRLVSLSTWLITRSARVLQVWFRCGSGVVQVWCKYGSIVVQGGSSAGALPAHLRLSSRATQACSFARASPDRARYVGAAAPTSLWRAAPFVAPEPTTAPDPARAWGPWQRATAPCPGCAPAPRWSRWSAQYRAPHGDVDAVSTPGNRARRHGSRNV